MAHVGERAAASTATAGRLASPASAAVRREASRAALEVEVVKGEKGGAREWGSRVVVGFSGASAEKRALWMGIVRGALHGFVEEGADVSRCTHLVVDEPLKRTVKLCVAISLPTVRIVTAAWLGACEQAGGVVSAEPYVLREEYHSIQMGWSFNAMVRMRHTAALACPPPLDLMHGQAALPRHYAPPEGLHGQKGCTARRLHGPPA